MIFKMAGWKSSFVVDIRLDGVGKIMEADHLKSFPERIIIIIIITDEIIIYETMKKIKYSFFFVGEGG